MSDSPFDTVCTILRTTLDMSDQDPIKPGTELQLLPNADSLRLLRTISALERKYDIELDDADIYGARTVADLTEIITNAITTPAGPSAPRGLTGK
ncbi:acyl carrier protein [Streptomyces sp. NPDC048275]|uniref:acyl carrier protein n=1 Tax=Streptomyces sp. NPDC048275 TaxID=3155629 RepID=UPI0033E101F2